MNGWFDENRKPTPRAIAEHWKRMEASDLQYPIVLSREFGLMDGMHRLMKAHATGKKSIKPKILNDTPQPDVVEPYKTP